MLTEGWTEPGWRISAGCGRLSYMLSEHLQNLMSVTSEQRMKWFYARWQATLRKVYPCFFCTHILLKQQKKMHLWKRPFRLSLFFLEGKTGKQSCCGHMCESFKQSPPLNCRNICGGRGHACISGGKAPLISHEVATIHEQVAKRIANVRFTTRTYKNPLFVRRVVGAAL